MIAWGVVHAGSVSGHLQNVRKEFVVLGRPVKALFQLPAVDDIADEVQGSRLHRAEVLEQLTSSAVSAAEVNVTYEDGSNRVGRDDVPAFG